MVKTCTKCSKTKALSLFHKDKHTRDGLTSHCKSCRNKARKEWGDLNKDKTRINALKSYYRHRQKKIEKQRSYYSENSEKVREYQKKYNYLNNDKIRENRSLYRKNNPNKIKAHYQLKKSIVAGEVIKKFNCEKCGSDYMVEGHHYDYGKPLDVVWLCKPCHNKEHRYTSDMLNDNIMWPIEDVKKIIKLNNMLDKT